LDTTSVPALISESCTLKAKKLAEEVMTIFHGVGMFCVELFVTEDESLFVNEVAPRPHNSGHYTIEGCLTSQFENHVRAITGLPLGDVTLRSPVVMRNLLGEAEASGMTYIEGLEAVCSLPEVKVHLYGKREVQPYRKMGHLTAVGVTLEEAKLKADRGFGMLKIKSEV
jgi:5-(carboxyamino)imidazole ribonucleotide synthase